MNSRQFEELSTILEEWYMVENRMLSHILNSRTLENLRLSENLHNVQRRVDMYRLSNEALTSRYNQLQQQHQQLGSIIRLILEDNAQIRRMYQGFVQLTTTGFIFNSEGELGSESETEHEFVGSSDEEEENTDQRVQRRLDFEEL